MFLRCLKGCGLRRERWWGTRPYRHSTTVFHGSVIQCRIAPRPLPPPRSYGHRSDGLIHLVMVKKCSRLQYLRFLLSLSHTGGCAPGVCFALLRVI